MKDFITYFKMIKFEHSVFALPFAFMSMVLAANGLPNNNTILWIVVAMISARTAAMGINRYVDKDIDAANPRTKDRDLPSGNISANKTLAYTITFTIIYFFAAYMLNRLTLILSPIPIIIFVLYSYSKRYTAFCHLLLGIALGLAPIGAWISVTGTISIVPIIISLAVIFWVAGFDMLYAIQDMDFDRENNLFSIPALIGVRVTLILSKVSHVITLIFLISLFFNSSLGYIYISGLIIISAFMAYEHSLLSKDDLSKLNIAFFNINAYISVTLGLFTIADILVQVYG